MDLFIATVVPNEGIGGVGSEKRGIRTRKKLASMMEWIGPTGMGLVFFFAYYFANKAVSRFHIMGPFAVMFMSGANGYH